MLTVTEAAEHACVSESLVYAWCADGTLPHTRMGRKGKRGTIRIAVEALDGVLSAFKVGARRSCSEHSENHRKDP
ncbi:dna-binding protein : : HTH_17 [Gemmata massiliana]|uniref:Dna-binding protein:: HTH_17 n=1 Tax=Gemmata massiliana TaxID=1210884 RepID=A0A6P2D095_9BACT|nr:dna-binding protein : : HTH_17 [Gemmata massiliana]